MKSRKELMDNFIPEKGEKIFELFYELMTGDIDFTTLNEEELIMAECVRNECTNENGGCYKFYKSLEKIRNNKSKEEIIDLYGKY